MASETRMPSSSLSLEFLRHDVQAHSEALDVFINSAHFQQSVYFVWGNQSARIEVHTCD
jgi:hypothetical protein